MPLLFFSVGNKFRAEEKLVSFAKLSLPWTKATEIFILKPVAAAAAREVLYKVVSNAVLLQCLTHACLRYPML